MPPPDAPATLLTDRDGVQQVLGRTGVDKRIDVDRTRVLSAAEQATLTFCLNYGTEFTWAWCGNRITLTTMATSWLFYTWSSIVAAYLLCLYRAGSVPASLQSEYEATLALFEKIHNGSFKPASVAAASGAGVAIDNVRYDPRYRNKTIRVQQSISDGHQQQRSPVRVDIPGRFIDAVQPDR